MTENNMGKGLGEPLTKDEAVAAFWFLLKMMGPGSRGILRRKMYDRPDVIGERRLLIRAINMYEADERVAQQSRIHIHRGTVE